jgi:ABC-type sugar transport system permease subunit
MSLEIVPPAVLEQSVTLSGQVKSRRRRGKQKQHAMAYLFVAPATLLFLAFIVYGIAYNLYNSFQGQTFYGTSVFVGWHHFASMLQDPVFWSALRNNGIWPASPNWLGSPQLVLLSVATVNIWQWTGFSMLLCLAAVQDIPGELREAAALDGASYWATARYVLLPLLTPATATLLILGLIGSLQTFTLVFVMTKGGPANASQVLGTYIYQKSFVEGNFGYGSAMSVVLLVITLVLTICQLAFFNRERRGA